MQRRILPSVGALVTFVAIGLMWACGGLRPPADHSWPPVHVTVIANDREPGGPCQVDSLEPFDFDVRPGDVVIWVVDNRCSTDLQLTDFVRIRPTTPGAGDPLDDVPDASSGKARIVPAGEMAKIVTRVRKPGPGVDPRTFLGRYQYTIETNDRLGWFSVCEEPPCPWDP